jgi:Flp pilus assembly protein TadD
MARSAKLSVMEPGSGISSIQNSLTRKNLLVLAAILVAGIAGIGIWLYLRPRVINLWVVSDYAFRERRDWDTVLDARFRAMNQLYRGTGIQWRVLNAEHLDPVSNIGAMDARRLELERRVESPADVVVSVTGQVEGERLASVNPFSHAIVVVDFPQQSEEQNTLNLAHEMARLFGAPVEPAGSGSLMAIPPRNATFSSPTRKLLRRLRDYNFARGIESLNAKWAEKALDALADAYNMPAPKPLAHAHLTLATALQNEKRSAEAVPHVREALKLDPQSVDIRQALAHILADDLQPDAALRELREAIRLFPDNASLHASLGAMLAKQVATDEAIGELRKAEELAPKDALYPMALGTLLVQQTGRLDDAVAEFEKAAQLDPKQAAARVWLARMSNVRAQATNDLEADVRKTHENPKDAEAHFRVGVDEARLGEHENARLAFQKAVELDPRHARALSDLAAMDYYCNDYEAAMRHVRAARAAGLDPPAALVKALERKLKPQTGPPQAPK